MLGHGIQEYNLGFSGANVPAWRRRISRHETFRGRWNIRKGEKQQHVSALWRGCECGRAAPKRRRASGAHAAEESQITVTLGASALGERNLKHLYSARVCARARDTELFCPFPLSSRQNGRARRALPDPRACLSARRPGGTAPSNGGLQLLQLRPSTSVRL